MRATCIGINKGLVKNGSMRLGLPPSATKTIPSDNSVRRQRPMGQTEGGQGRGKDKRYSYSNSTDDTHTGAKTRRNRAHYACNPTPKFTVLTLRHTRRSLPSRPPPSAHSPQFTPRPPRLRGHSLPRMRFAQKPKRN